MTYETISVRMNRSDRNIRWGFSVRQQADGLVIDRVEAESLSDKAGVKTSDKVEQINGRPTRGLDANSANRLIDDSFNEVRLSLQRFVTSHTTLPWTLNEKDNKMVVEEVRPGFGSGFGATTQFHKTNFGNGGFNASPVPINYGGTTSSTTSRNTQSTTQNHRSTVIPVHVDSTTNWINQDHYGKIRTPPPHSNGVGSRGVNFGTRTPPPPPTSYNYNNGSQGSRGVPPPASYSYNNGATNQSYGTGSGGLPLNQMTFINTNGNGVGAGSQGGLSPSKVFYHSPSSRSRNDLSPGASVHHLQYNSPMNLYSSEAVAEQYFQQTGQQPEGPVPHDKRPAYLTSETKKLIEEEARGRFNRGKSPSSQSSCFKRISHAVGADH